MVVAVVETHGRMETEVLTKGFEVIPKKRSLYKGHVVAEMDLDAVLQRRPKLALVDELAHTNAEGSRHPKRYQDVEELLAAGIDVYTTINIQHIDSLNDVVAQITRIHVRETVPDYVLDEADEIELVDTTPDELLGRLKEGKVYVKAQAERALKHFFQPGNLAALRELGTAQGCPAGRPGYGRLYAGPCHRRPLGRRASTSCAASMNIPPQPSWCGGAGAWPTISKGLSRSSMSKAPRHLKLSEIEKDRVADTMRIAAAPRRGNSHFARPRNRRHGPGIRPAQERHPNPDRKI